MKKLILVIYVLSAAVSGCGPSLADCRKKKEMGAFVPYWCVHQYGLEFL